MDNSGHNGGTRVEQTLLRVMQNAGLGGLRCQAADLPGTPDAVSDDLRIACFANGCFWHAHERCRLARVPGTNANYWRQKFERNKARDRRAIEALGARGWKVLTVWECADRLADPAELQKCVNLVVRHGLRRTEVVARTDGSRKCSVLCQ